MSNENDRADNTWSDQDEGASPHHNFRDAYLNAINRHRLRPRSGNIPQESAPETPERPNNRTRPRSGRIYEESDERPSRPRPTRQSREEVYARLRQRPRQPVYARDQDETRARPPAQAKNQTSARRVPAEDYPHHQSAPPATPRASRGPAASSAQRPGPRAVEYDEYEVIERNRGGRRSPTRSRRRRGGRVLSTVLTGCLGGIITLAVVAAVIVFLLLHNTPLGQNLGIGKSTYTRAGRQALSPGSATQVIVRSMAGNVTVSIDQSASSGSLSSVRKVLASSQSDANTQFRALTLTTKQISQGADPVCTASSCLLITASVPTSGSNNLLGGSNGDAIDLTLSLPASFNSPDPLSPYTISVNAQAGDIAVNGFNGVLNLTGRAGNINVSRALIYAGTCIQTNHGNVVVNQGSFFDLNQASNQVPCSATTGAGPHPWFNIKSGVGNVDIALPASSTNLLLDANTNNGKISNDFGPSIPTGSDGSATYHGPLLPNANPTASLYVSTSTGNIAIRKQ